MPLAWKLDRILQIAETVLFASRFLFLFFTSVTMEKLRSASAFEWGKELNELIILNLEKFSPR